MLQPQNVPVKLTSGIDEKSDPKSLQTKLTVLQNASFQSPGQIQKRDGFKSLPSLSNGVGIASFKNELVSMDGSNLYSYSPDLNLNTAKGALVNTGLSVSPVVNNNYNHIYADEAYDSVSGLKIVASIGGIGSQQFLYYSVIDSTTGNYVVNNAQIGTTASYYVVQCFVLGSNFIVLTSNSSSLVYYSVGTSTPSTISGPVTVTSSLIAATSTVFDSIVVGGTAYICCSTTGGSTVMTFFSLSSSLVLSSPHYLLSSSTTGFANQCVSLSSDASGNIWVAYGYYGASASPMGLYLGIISSSFSVVLAPVMIDGALSSSGTAQPVIANLTQTVTGSTTTIFYEVYATGYVIVGLPSSIIKSVTCTIAGVFGTPAVVARGVGLASQAFIYNGQSYFLAVYAGVISSSPVARASLGVNVYGSNTTGEATYFLLNSSGLCILKLAPLLAGYYYPYGIIPSVSSISSNKFIIPYLNENSAILYSSSTFKIYGVNEATISFGNQLGLPKVVAANNLHVSGGLLFMYDSSNVVEHGFNVYPENLALTVHSTTAASYQYVATYKWTDNEGQIHRSAPSLPLQVNYDPTVIPGNTVTVPTLRLTQKQNVTVELWRTANNGTIFYLVTSPIVINWQNNTAVDFLSIQDSATDASIIGNTQLYTTGGVIDNIAAPSVSALATFKNRVVYLSPENPTQWGYSQQIIPGTPVEFNSELLVENIDQQIGQALAVKALDDKLILFGATSKYYVVGQGPGQNGNNNDFSEATKIAGVSGCSNQASVVEIPSGLIYQDSVKGIYLLDRSLGEVYIGADVEAYNGYTITSAQKFETQNKVTFTLNNGVNLVYDYFVNQWEIDIFSAAAIDSTIFQNDFVYIQGNGTILQQTPGVYQDNGAVIPMQLQTGWIPFSGLEGFGRVWELQLMGTYYSPHTLTVSIYTNYSSVASQITTIPVPSDPGLYQFRIRLTQQKCESIMINITETQSGTPGRGFSLSSLAFKVGSKKGLYKLTAGASY